MCAIAGLINLQGRDREDAEAAIVKTMCKLQTHRGPDDCGVISLGHVHLGANRLSILDLSAAGHMPMSDQLGQQWIVYNGELYNFRELKAELQQHGHVFHSQTDTEVVLRAFMQWGEACLERFVGMFAFAVYDQSTDTLTLVRDRFGKKPLYYMFHDESLLFASELKTLMNVKQKRRIHERRLVEWALYRNVDFDGRETLIEGCFMLPPGHFMQIHRGKVQTPVCYYAPEDSVDADLYQRFAHLPQRQLIDEMDALIQSSVRDRLVSDAPVGTLCSGGLDSSLVTALCAQHRQDIQAYHVSVSDSPDLNELQYAQHLTQKLDIKLITCTLSAELFRRYLPRAVYYSDLPLTHPNSVAYLTVCELARQHGTLVLLTGEAADELFGGYMHRYRRYRQFLWAQRLVPYLPQRIVQTLMIAGHVCSGVYATELEGYGVSLPFAINMLDKFARTDLRLRCDQAYDFVPNANERALLGAMLGDLSNFLAPLLRRLDRMSMAASVECRVPFLDHRLVAAALNLPLSYRLKGSTDKWLLKTIATRYVPRHIVYRKKMGFPLPLESYLAPLAQPAFFQDGFCVNVLGLSPRGIQELLATWRNHMQSFYNLLVLEMWGRLHIYGESIEDMTQRVAEI